MVPENNLIFVEEELLTPKEVSAITKIKTTTLGSWRWSGKGPKYCKVGGSVRYPKSQLEQWIQGGFRNVQKDLSSGIIKPPDEGYRFQSSLPLLK